MSNRFLAFVFSLPSCALISNLMMQIYSLPFHLPSCLGQETAKWPLRSLSQAATRYYQS